MNRRTFLQATASGFFAAPAVMSRVLQESAAPAMPGGVQVGDVTTTHAMIWSATDRAARMMVEFSRDERFTSPRRIEGPVALDTTNFTAKLDRSLSGRRAHVFSSRSCFSSRASLGSIPPYSFFHR